MPEICGKRPVPPVKAGLQDGRNPLVNAVSSWAPVSVSITVRLPNGRTENISPQVISHGCSPALGGVQLRSARRPPELVYAASTPGYFSRIASATMLPIADSNRRVGARLMSNCWVPMTLVAQDRGLGVGLVDDRLDVGTAGHADVLGHAGRAAGPLDVAVADHELEHRVAGAGVVAPPGSGTSRTGGWRCGGCGPRASRPPSCPGAGPRSRGSGRPRSGRRRCRWGSCRWPCPGGSRRPGP